MQRAPPPKAAGRQLLQRTQHNVEALPALFAATAAFRKAAALTAFTVALGAFAPGIASMSEATLTERGVLPMADYPGALVLLPTMFWGISFGKLAPTVTKGACYVGAGCSQHV